MKTCSQCGRSYADDLFYCLSDGSPLIGTSKEPTVRASEEPIISTSEEPTVVRPRFRGNKRSRGTNILLIALAALLSLSLGITAAVLYFFWPRDQVANEQNGSNRTATTVATPSQTGPSPSPSPLPRVTRTPEPTPRVEQTPSSEDGQPPPVTSDPGPARVTFSRGSSQTMISGAVVRSRSYLLYASPGQRLRGTITGGDGCAVFDNGVGSIDFRTAPGDNVLTVINDCDSPVRFRLNVSIR